MKDIIKRLIEDNRETGKTLLSEKNLKSIELAAGKIIESLKKGNKILSFGNGGSAADSQHFVAELVGRFKKERKGIPAISLTTNTSTITALANDYTYGVVFERQIEALGKRGDIAFGISTSGTAKNVLAGLRKAKGMGLFTVALTGKGGSEAKNIADLSLIVESDDTARVQEAHILIIHILCELVENTLE